MEDGQPTVWATYVSVEDAEATAAKVTEAGGEPIVEPMDVPGLGTMAVFTDPTGAVFGIWQPGTFAGAELVNEYGAFGWNELGTRDTAAAKEFYGAVFGWGTAEDRRSGRAGHLHGLESRRGDGRRHARHRPPSVCPTRCRPTGSSTSRSRTPTRAVEKVKGGGGDVRIGPIDIPVGRFAVVADPYGAVFAVMQPSEETLANMP